MLLRILRPGDALTGRREGTGALFGGSHTLFTTPPLVRFRGLGSVRYRETLSLLLYRVVASVHQHGCPCLTGVMTPAGQTYPVRPSGRPDGKDAVEVDITTRRTDGSVGVASPRLDGVPILDHEPQLAEDLLAVGELLIR